jgi:AcrR family transcriptional regulator
VAPTWGREDDPDQAVARILEAAEKVFLEVGVAAAVMSDVAEAAGCSRGTLYRYFPSRESLYLAYVERSTRDINQRVLRRVEQTDDAVERLTQAVCLALEEVRADPAAAAWFSPSAEGLGSRVGRADAIERVNRPFAAELLGHELCAGPDGAMRVAWLSRIVISMLIEPIGDEDEEREAVGWMVACLLAQGPDA